MGAFFPEAGRRPSASCFATNNTVGRDTDKTTAADSCNLQDFEALTPNLLARTVETVEGGGVVILLLSSLSSLSKLYTMTMVSLSPVCFSMCWVNRAETPGSSPCSKNCLPTEMIVVCSQVVLSLVLS